MTDFLTIAEAAERLRKPSRWLRDWLRANPPPDGEPPYYLQAGRNRLFSPGDLVRIEGRLRERENEKREPRAFNQKRGHIYFIEISGFIKIGWALNAKTRISGFQVGSPLPVKLIGVALGTMQDEKELHRKFSEHRERGEWFRSNPRLKREIKALTNHNLLRACQ